MFIRCAFFQGNVKPGKEQAFNDYIRKELVPLWTRFPGAQEVRVLRQVESDVADPHFGMVLSVRYPTRESIEIALASEVHPPVVDYYVCITSAFSAFPPPPTLPST